MPAVIAPVPTGVPGLHGRAGTGKIASMIDLQMKKHIDMKRSLWYVLLLAVPCCSYAQAPISQPLVKHIFTADPSAHVFGGRIYIYPSHDIESNVPEDDEGGHFDMKDYHVLSMDKMGGKVTDHGVALDIKDVPWAGRQMWAPDAAYANN